MKRIILLFVLLATLLSADTDLSPLEMSCKKLYVLSDSESNAEVFRNELYARCDIETITKLDTLRKAYKDATTNEKRELVKKMIELEDQLEVK
jgi:hypothetical protein